MDNRNNPQESLLDLGSSSGRTLQRNQIRQIKAVVHRLTLQKKRQPGQALGELMNPLIYGFALWIMGRLTACETISYCSDYEKDYFRDVKNAWFPFMCALIVPFVSSMGARFTLQTMVEEKHSKMKDSLKIMSLTSVAYGVSYVILQLFYSLIGMIAMGLFVFNNKELFGEHTMGRSLLFLFATYWFTIGQVTQSMALSTFFHDSKVSQEIGGFLLLVPILVYLKLVMDESSLVYLFFWLPLFPGVTIFSQMMIHPGGFILLNTQYISTGACWTALLLLPVFWFSIYLYLEQVVPNEFGISKHPLFFLKKDIDVPPPASSSSDNFQTVGGGDNEAGCKAGSGFIHVKDLTKRFGSLRAVDRVNFQIPSDTVFTLLGHNGAGKTTVINMLTGILEPTAGDIIVDGISVRKNLDKVQVNLGLCQQFDVLFDSLTVEEHLEFVCEVKNMPMAQKKEAVEQALSKVMLEQHKDKLVTELSGGMKRKLSLAMAIVTKPKVLVLDEPTSGLDVESRRQIWELIKLLKKDRSIIMSSQHLEEADELADRILIMTSGTVLKEGTPQEIKLEYGFGYKLLIRPEQESTEFQAEVDGIILKEDVCKHQDSTLKQLTYTVPFTPASHMEEVLTGLRDAGIDNQASVDFEMSTLEDAFLNIAKKEEEKTAPAGQTVGLQEGKRKEFEEEVLKYRNMEAKPSFFRQLFASFKRRVLWIMKQPRQILIGINPALYCFLFLGLFVQIFVFIQGKVDANASEDRREESKKALIFFFSFIFPFAIVVSLSMASAIYVTSLVQDREQKLRYLLNFTGVSSGAYIIGLMLADVLFFMLPSSIFVGGSWAMKFQGFYQEIGEIFLSLMIFALPFIALNQLISFLFSKTETAFKYHSMPFFTLQVLLPFFFLTQVRNIADFWNLVRTSITLSPVNALIALLYVHFARGLIDAQIDANQQDASMHTEEIENLYSIFDDLIKYAYKTMLIQALIFFTITLVLDYIGQQRFKIKDGNHSLTHKLRTLLPKSEGVKSLEDETREGWENHQQTHLVQCKNLAKIYPMQQVPGMGLRAVHNNTLSIAKGEVLGLLGPNGAGKSTMFGILTLDLKRTGGSVKLMNTNFEELKRKDHFRFMGMCPQFNTFWDVLTVDQNLRFIGETKGIYGKDLEFELDFIKKLLSLQDYSKTRAHQLSGGNMRKLVCAMSLVGSPKIEFLDEPTTGVDPVSRRSLFSMLRLLDDSSILMTTHRMDEAEALCSKIGIMINGRLARYGSATELKNENGEGYTVYITHATDPIGDQLPEGLFKEQTTVNLDGSLMSVFKLQRSSLADLLETWKQLGQLSSISDFKMTRSSLEHVFIKLAKNQDH